MGFADTPGIRPNHADRILFFSSPASTPRICCWCGPPAAIGRSRFRLAIGASRWRVVRQLLLESLVLGAGSTLIALPLAWLGLQAASAYLLIAAPIDIRVLLIAVATAAISAVASGLAPAFLMTRTPLARALTPAQSGGDGTPQRTRGRRALVVAQVALSLGLLAVALSWFLHFGR